MQDVFEDFLGQFIAWQTTPDRQEDKKKCLEWIYESFLKNSLSPSFGEVDGAPYLSIEHPEPKMLWFAHIDVVPAAEELFAIKTDQKLHRFLGRGVKDMKGAALCFLLAYRDAISAGTIPPVSILLTSDEETAGHTIPKLLGRGLCKAPVAFTPDTGSNPAIVVEHKGVIWADLIARGTGGHAAMPWLVHNPIELLSVALEKIRSEFPAKKGEWAMSVTPTQLKGSEARNQIPHSASCSLDIRFTADEYTNPAEAINRVKKILPQNCELTIVSSAAPLKTDPNIALVKLMQQIGEEVTGESVEIGREHGASDARYFAEHGIPSFLYGPTGGDLHAPTEWVSISSLLHHYAINAKVLAAL